tara:strand:- start:47 stop:424 length:378 start_codon:yes stop_codon:yes gene_type:complete
MSLGLLKIFLLFLFFSASLIAEPIAGNFATFKLLDKITNKVSQKEIEVNSIVNWDSLNIQIYSCYSTPPEEIPEDYVLLEVKDMLTKNNQYLYRGWMISSSPDVTSIEHPIYDLWLVDCKIDKTS